MTTLKLLLAEIGYRKINFAMSLLAVVVAVMLFVAGPMLIDGYSGQTRAKLQELEDRVGESVDQVRQAESHARQEMAALQEDARRLMRDLGFNLMLVHRDTDMVSFLSTRLPTIDLSEDCVRRLAKDRRLTLVTHLVATLRARQPWEGQEVYLAGYLPEATQSHMQHESPMGYTVPAGNVFLGHQLGKGKKVGETVTFKGKEFRIAEILPAKGNEEDVTVAMHLSDAQAVLEKPGKINLILALECRCPIDALPAIQRQLALTLPEIQALRDTSKADARAEMRSAVAKKNQQLIARQKEILAEHERTLEETRSQRQNVQGLMESLAGVVTPLVVLVSAVWVGLLALANVRQRRAEIGLLRALGKGSGTIWSLLLGKAVLLGLLGATAGCLLGLLIAWWLNFRALEVSSEHFVVRYDVLLCALLGAPLVSAVASYLPTLSALLEDPAVVLREQ